MKADVLISKKKKGGVGRRDYIKKKVRKITVPESTNQIYSTVFKNVLLLIIYFASFELFFFEEKRYLKTAILMKAYLGLAPNMQT